MRASPFLTTAALSAAAMFAASGASAAYISSGHAVLGPSLDAPVTVTQTLCTETSASGCVAALPIDTGTTAASDGEASFDPFNFGSDTSDGIALSAIWSQAVSTPSWQNIAGTNTWVIPSCVGGICENRAVPEGIGHWAAPGYSLVGADLLVYNILEADGTLSDRISLFNDASGTVQLTFESMVPEPASWAMMLVGIGGLGVTLRSRRKAIPTV